jgi:dienelactone hydrolase
VLLLLPFAGLNGQVERSTVNFFSEDSLLITADVYLTRDTLPFILLFHEQGSSRGEFDNIIHRFQKMNFNCLSVDIRNGGNASFIANETEKRCRAGNFSTSTDAIEGDFRSAVNYAFGRSGEPLILLGSGANGSMALKTAKEQDVVKAAIALSPGEYFLNNYSIEDTISGMEKPILVTANQIEKPYVEQLVAGIEAEFKTVFAPEEAEGMRGTAALLSDNPSEGEYWLSILLFFKDLQ